MVGSVAVAVVVVGVVVGVSVAISVGVVGIFYSFLPPTENWNIFNFVLKVCIPFGNGSTGIQSMELVVLDGGNLPVRFIHVFTQIIDGS